MAAGRPLRITTRNSTFQVFDSLRTNRQKRRQAGACLVEGVRPLSIALEQGWAFDAVLQREDGALSNWAKDVLARTRGATHYVLSTDLFAALSGKDEPSEILAIVRTPLLGADSVQPRVDLLIAVMDRPGNPGNLGTLVRTCDALGVHALVLTGHAADPYDPSAITASRGSVFALPLVQLPSPADVARLVDRVRDACGRCRVVAADERGTVVLADADLSRPLVTVFGNETNGLSRAYMEMADTLVRIPMTGTASSLNVSVAASIVLYEATRRG